MMRKEPLFKQADGALCQVGLVVVMIAMNDGPGTM